MKKLMFLSILIFSGLSANGQNTPVATWSSSNLCGLQEYVRQYNQQHPETQLFIEDLSKISSSGPMTDVLMQIDTDERSAYLAAQVVRCMVSPSRFLPNRLESTLQEAFRLYFADRSSRRALRVFFEELDAAYLTTEQRAANLQRKTSWLVNATDAAVYGTWAASVALWIAKKGRGASPVPRPGLAKPQMTQSADDAQRMYARAARWLSFKQWLGNTAKVAGIATATGVSGGSVTYLARKNGWLNPRIEDSITEIERVYHRLHWLELDCRARTLQAEVAASEFKSGDARQINHLINDFNFLVDVSQLYYSEVAWPADFLISGNTVTYKNVRLDCPVGFSKTDMRRVVIADVKSSVSQAGLAYLEKYSQHLYKPMNEKLEQLYAKHHGLISSALGQMQDNAIWIFLSQANSQVASELETAPEKMMEMISAYVGVRSRLDGRAEFYVQWAEAFNALPEASRQAINAFNREVITMLPTPLVNQLILEQLSREDMFPTNLIVLFQLGLTIEQAEQQQMIQNKEQYLLPHELLFYLRDQSGALQ